jgi:hypothetical protein
MGGRSMKLHPRPQGVLERIALLLNLAPLPLVDPQIAFSNARAIMAAATLGVAKLEDFVRTVTCCQEI